MNNTAAQIVVIDDHRVVGLGVKAAFEDQGADASIVWSPTVREARWKRGQVAVLDLRLADGSAPDKNIAYINGYGIPVVVYTSGDDPYLVRRAIAGGALSIIRKTAPPDDLVEAVMGSGVEQTVQGHDEGLPALETEALLAHVLGLQEGLEGLGLLQLGEDPTALLVTDVLPVALEALLPPGSLGRVLDVHVLHAHGAAVGVAQHLEDLAQGGPVAPAQAPGGEGAVRSHRLSP